jgi:4-hydroxybenzoate polyprenyltransferase/phosphoserine phosphatase
MIHSRAARAAWVSTPGGVAAGTVAGASERPLCVRLDGAVVRTDLGIESLIFLVKRDVQLALHALLWLCRGRAFLRDQVARRSMLQPQYLPYNVELIDWLRSEKRRGRSIWLCTDANERLAECVATHLAVFDGVIASDSKTHLSRGALSRRLVETFGHRQFDYCGSTRDDLPAWRSAHTAVVVCATRALEQKAARVAPQLQTFPRRIARARALLRALRPHQWAKNVLVFAPLLAAHRALDAAGLFSATLAFIAFCLCASSVYLVNDMLDLEADRMHSHKSGRPFATGDLPVAAGLQLVPLLLSAAALISTQLPIEFAATLGTYYVLSLAYSFGIKGVMLLDTVVLAALYTSRVIAGGLATHAVVSFWMLLFSIFIFLSLAFVKRYAELDALRRSHKVAAEGRSYNVHDLPILESLGTGAGYMSVVVLALYINSPTVETLYRRPEYIWAVCVLLLYWIARIWMKAHRGRMDEDPVLFALQDRVSIGIALVCAIALGLAI